WCPCRRIVESTWERSFAQRESAVSREPVEQRLCLFQVGGVEAFGEPAVDRREKIAGFGAAALVAAEPGEAWGAAQFPELGPLLRGNAQGYAIQFLGGPVCPCCSSSSPLCR